MIRILSLLIVGAAVLGGWLVLTFALGRLVAQVSHVNTDEPATLVFLGALAEVWIAGAWLVGGLLVSSL